MAANVAPLALQRLGTYPDASQDFLCERGGADDKSNFGSQIWRERRESNPRPPA